MARLPLLGLVAAGSLALAVISGCSAGVDGEDTSASNPSASEALTMPACGTALGTFDGTTAYSNGANTGTGVSCAGGGSYGLRYQCVELVMRHFKTHWGLRWYGNAKTLLAGAPKDSVDVYYNGDKAHPPVAGDMIVWPNGAYGHVALVTAVHASSIDILEQNVKGSGKATLTYANGKIGARWGNWVPQGWAHAKANGGGQNQGGGGDTDAGGGGVSWDCASSSYAGNQYWTCSGSARYRCSGGVAEVEACPDGCQSNAVGTDDTCKTPPPPPPPPVNWDCASSSYAGNQYWTCSGSARYKCSGGVPQKDACPNGCQSNALGTDDTCK